MIEVKLMKEQYEKGSKKFKETLSQAELLHKQLLYFRKIIDKVEDYHRAFTDCAQNSMYFFSSYYSGYITKKTGNKSNLVQRCFLGLSHFLKEFVQTVTEQGTIKDIKNSTFYGELSLAIDNIAEIVSRVSSQADMNSKMYSNVSSQLSIKEKAYLESKSKCENHKIAAKNDRDIVKSMSKLVYDFLLSTTEYENQIRHMKTVHRNMLLFFDDSTQELASVVTMKYGWFISLIKEMFEYNKRIQTNMSTFAVGKSYHIESLDWKGEFQSFCATNKFFRTDLYLPAFQIIDIPIEIPNSKDKISSHEFLIVSPPFVLCNYHGLLSNQSNKTVMTYQKSKDGYSVILDENNNKQIVLSSSLTHHDSQLALCIDTHLAIEKDEVCVLAGEVVKVLEVVNLSVKCQKLDKTIGFIPKNIIMILK